MNHVMKLIKFCDKYFIDHRINVVMNDRKLIIEQVALQIEYIVYNIVTMLCLITIINDTTQITDKTLGVGKKYIESKCNISYSIQSGGMGSATFLGVKEPQYSERNSTADILPVDFEKGLARPQIGGSSMHAKHMKTLKSIILEYIDHILKHHNVTANNKVKSELFKIIKFHTDCLFNYIEHKDVVTKKTMKYIIKHQKMLKPLK